MPPKTKKTSPLPELEKAPTGIRGFDQITYGGIPRGRPTLICGNAGCGKTLMALEILIRGAVEYGEPGVFITFEETKNDLIENVRSMGYDLQELIQKKLIFIDYIYVDTKGYEETGEYDLEGLFIRIENGVKSINAKRVAIDTIEVLFSGFLNEAILRSEIRRLFLWFKERQLTTVVTGEQGLGPTLTRKGIEEYVADCVISLTHRIKDELYTRRLQIIKYRGSYHETNEFPFLIGRKGIFLLPVTSLEMIKTEFKERISTGIPKLDDILEGKGYFVGSSILISGSSGAGKTTFAASFARSFCMKGKKCLFLSYEESESEILKNMVSVGNDLHNFVQQGLLRIETARPTQWGLEKHLGNFIEIVEEFKPDAVIIDPINTLSHCGTESQIYSVLVRMIDFVKKQGGTLLMNMLYFENQGKEFSFGISSIIDTWILLRNSESNGEMNRELLVVKSRGMAHSNQVREFTLSSDGIDIKEPYFGEAGVLTGSSRIVQEHKDILDKAANELKLKKLHHDIELKKQVIKGQIEGLESEIKLKEIEAKEEEKFLILQEKIHQESQNFVQKIRKGRNSGAGHGKKGR